MAGNSDIIREYLVSLGFKINQNSMNKFDGALVKTAKSAVGFATALVGVGTATTKFVEHVASQMEDLYWSSVRVRAGVANIQDFKLALSKVGGTAEGAAAALENVARYMRTSPVAEGLLNNLGVHTRDGNNELRSTIDIVKDFAHLPMPYWLKVQWANKFGIDENTLLAMGKVAADDDSIITKLYKSAGINANEASKKSVEFNNKLRDLGAMWGVLSVVLETRLLPLVNRFVDLIGALIGGILKLDEATGGIATQFGLLAIVIWGVNTALRVAFGAGIAQLMWKMLGNIALMTVTAFPALAEAIWAVGVAFSEGLIPAIWAAVSAMVVFLATNPIGWAILIGAAIAGAAYLIIKNWDKVKAYFGQFVDWLKTKYNSVAKIFGLPQWEDKKTPEEKQHQLDVINGKSGSEGSSSEKPVPDEQNTHGEKPVPDQKNAPDKKDKSAPRTPAPAPVPGQQSAPDKSATNKGAAPAPVPDKSAPNKGAAPAPVPDSKSKPADNISREQPVNNAKRSSPIDPKHEPGMPDWQEREKDLGPNSYYGSDADHANDNFSNDPRVTGKALEFFKKVGWSADQAAGIVSNLIHESKLNSRAVGDSGNAYGIGQWHKDRQDKFKEWAGHDIHSSTLDEQLGFVNHELTKGAERFAGKMLAGAQNAADAGMRVSKYYERPKDEVGEMAKRGRTAASLVDTARVAPTSNGKTNVTIHQKTDIQVSSSDPESAGRAVERGQSRVNGDLVRNFAGAQT